VQKKNSLRGQRAVPLNHLCSRISAKNSASREKNSLRKKSCEPRKQILLSQRKKLFAKTNRVESRKKKLFAKTNRVEPRKKKLFAKTNRVEPRKKKLFAKEILRAKNKTLFEPRKKKLFAKKIPRAKEKNSLRKNK
jgi:uncharacterized protein (DUF3084 family)